MTKEEKQEVASADKMKTRGSRDRHQKKDKPKPLTKVVIRRLPPTMTEEEFLKQIDPLPAHDFYYYATADWSLGFDATCRAYITFQNHEDVFLFRDRFDGYVFVDTKGEEYSAVVEFAPFQGLPKNKARKTDPKVNTIDVEQHYIGFLQKLEEDREACKSECKLEFSLQPKEDKKITSTPLLQFLMNKKMERREEQKKRTEDNRRKREEDKQKRRNRLAKGLPSVIKEENIPLKEGKPKTEGQTDNPEEKKNSRAKRRAERDQRRRDEYEKEKLRLKALQSADPQQQKKEGDNPPKPPEGDRKRNEMTRDQRRREEYEQLRKERNKQKTLQTAESHPGKESETAAKPSEGDHRRKEIKKYSERRETNRNKNLHNTAPASGGVTGKFTSTVAASTVEEKPSVKDNNAMVNFMKNVSNVKEFVPKHKQEKTNEIKAVSKLPEAAVDMEDLKKELEKISVQEGGNRRTPSIDKEDELVENKSERADRSQRNSSSSGGYTNDTRGEDRFDRRIRNKDRPSIAIYQPGKTRLRSSEDGQPGADLNSNPTSDTESLKKEERPSTARKVSRYSERRSGRARDGRRRNSGEDKVVKTPDLLKEEKTEKQMDEKKEPLIVEKEIE